MTKTEYIRATNRITDATLTTACARCAAPLEVTDDTGDAVSKAHEERCFAPGDIAEWRLDGLTWERVTVVRAYPGDKFEIQHHRTVERWQVHRSAMRHVSKEQAVASTSCCRGGPCNMPSSGGPCIDCGYPRAYARAEDISGALEVDAVYVGGTALVVVADRRMTPGYVRVVQRRNYQFVDHPIPSIYQFVDHPIPSIPSPGVPEPLPPLYDGLTGDECVARWSGNRTCVEHGQPPLFAMTPAQISEGKRQWAAHLAAKGRR